MVDGNGPVVDIDQCLPTPMRFQVHGIGVVDSFWKWLCTITDPDGHQAGILAALIVDTNIQETP
jgi:hypothetical protein